MSEPVPHKHDGEEHTHGGGGHTHVHNGEADVKYTAVKAAKPKQPKGAR